MKIVFKNEERYQVERVSDGDRSVLLVIPPEGTGFFTCARGFKPNKEYDLGFNWEIPVVNDRITLNRKTGKLETNVVNEILSFPSYHLDAIPEDFEM